MPRSCAVSLAAHFGAVPLAAVLASVIGVMTPLDSAAQTTCVRATNKVVKGKVVTSLSKASRTKCRKGEVAALTGPTGATGATGADGQLRIYGDGSDGAKIVAANETLSDSAAMYTDVVIDSGMTWTIPSGAVIRCTGSFENNGTITVQTGAPGGEVTGADTSLIFPVYSSPHPGISARAASSGEFGDGTNVRSGGRGGFGLSLFQAKMLRYPGIFGGGGGAGGAFSGADGGGSVVILCNGGITNNGLIRANAANGAIGAGGGGGGVIILASRTSVVSSAGSTIQAKGGNGGNSGSVTGPSGGGGGGIVLLISPAVNTTGATVTVTGGNAGADSGNPINLTPRSGGHGGGGSGGLGGTGGSVLGTSVNFDALPGTDGHSLVTLEDPTPLF